MIEWWWAAAAGAGAAVLGFYAGIRSFVYAFSAAMKNPQSPLYREFHGLMDRHDARDAEHYAELAELADEKLECPQHCGRRIAKSMRAASRALRPAPPPDPE